MKTVEKRNFNISDPHLDINYLVDLKIYFDDECNVENVEVVNLDLKGIEINLREQLEKSVWSDYVWDPFESKMARAFAEADYGTQVLYFDKSIEFPHDIFGEIIADVDGHIVITKIRETREHPEEMTIEELAFFVNKVDIGTFDDVTRNIKIYLLEKMKEQLKEECK